MLCNKNRMLHVNAERLWTSLMDMAKVGPGLSGGNNRQALTDADAAGRALFRSWCEQEGMVINVDRMGTMFAMRAGSDADANGVYLGSHLDTQPTGGRFDGVLGVLAGLEVVRTLNDLGIATCRPIVVTNWANEEGSRFAPPMLSSGVFAGVHSLEFAHSRTDAEGRTYGEELARIGWMGTQQVGARRMHAYLEYHIEQGPILEAESKAIGVVTHCQGFRWVEITLTGRESHTGSTPMTNRVDASLAMSRIIEMVHSLVMANQPNALGGVGHAIFSPNSRNVLPRQVTFTVDLRSPDRAMLEGLTHQMCGEAERIASAIGVACKMDIVGKFDPVAFDPSLVSMVRSTAEMLELSNMDIVSGAGHDACWIAGIAPTTMIMCPCVDGVSHNEAEKIYPEWAAAGADVLLNAALSCANNS